MITNRYITNSCIIAQGRVYKNGEGMYTGAVTPLSTFLLSVYQYFAFNYPKFYKMDNLSKLGWLAAELLLKDAGLAARGAQVGVILANANSSLDNDLKYVQTIAEGASPSVFVYTLPNIVIGEICIRHHFKGEHAFFIQDEFDGGFILKQVNYLLNGQLAKACICGWVDVLGDDYKAALFLVEDRDSGGAIAFTAQNMAKIFDQIK